MKVLQLTVHFSPNVGGVETHLSDLVKFLVKQNIQVFVLCYQPLSVKVGWKMYEKETALEIFRIPWIAGLFYKLIKSPILEFIYLVPGLFIITPLILVIKNPKIIHAHGIVAGFVAVFWGKLFNKRIIISTHSIYSFPKSGLYHDFARFIFVGADQVLCLSNQSKNELIKLISVSKLKTFTYWIDLNKFTRQKESSFKFKEKFVVLFVGRLILEKGLDVLLDSVKSWNKNIGLVIAGTGPLENLVKKQSSENFQIHFQGKVDQSNLPDLYNSVNLLIVPSTTEEGFGRVIIESLACGTPVVAANRGAITEAMDSSVGRLIDISPQSIKNAVEDLYNHPAKLNLMAKNARSFAERRYSEKNGQTIINSYKD